MEAGQFIETSVKIGMMGHLKIWDPESGDVFVNKKNKINFENMSRCIANKLANNDNFSIYEMHFGNAGTITDSSGNVTYRAEKVNLDSDSLYNDVFYKNVDIIDADNTNITKNKMEVNYTTGNIYSDIVTTCTLDYTEPSTTDNTFNLYGLSQSNDDTATSIDGNFIFDEIGLKSKAAAGRNTGLLLTHVVFHPVQKSANRLIQIIYTIRVRTDNY